jgi:TPR repeat protein
VETQPHPADLFRLEFVHSSPEMGGILSAEAAVVPFESLAQHALENGRAVFSKLNIASQEHRTVCGKDVLFLVLEGTMNNHAVTTYGYYYTGPEGTAQSVTFFETKDLETCKGLALDFLNGLQIGPPGTAPTANKTTAEKTAVQPASNSVPPVSSPTPEVSGVANVDIKALNASVPYKSQQATLAKLKAILSGDPAKVAKRLQPAVDKKDPFAMFLMGQMYASGTGVSADPARAVDLMKQAVAADLTAAEAALGSWYVSGYQVPKDWKEAERLLRRAADAGSADGQARLGEILLASDPKAGVELFRKAADQGWAVAEYRLALCYLNGTGVEKNAEEELKWVQRASQHGNLEAKTVLGMYCLKKPGIEDRAEAVKYFTEAAKAGLPAAQNNLAICLQTGNGTPVDRPEAVKWLQKAAEQGLADAQKNLGYAYAHGQGVAADYKQAVYWYEKAAKQGEARAEFWMGVACLQGSGVEKDVRTAIEWFHKSADKNDLLAYWALGGIYRRGTEVPQDNAEAVKWFRKGAEGGDANCQEQLAECLFNGFGVEKDQNEAVKWVTKAAAVGIPRAELLLGIAYMKGAGSLEKSDSTGIEWVRKAAEQGDGMAQFKLGMAYERGEGVAVSPEDGAKWFRLAAIHGNPYGENAYGYALATGEGVKQDLVEAYKWYLLAMAQKEADPKSRAEVNKKAILPQMTPDQIVEGEKRAASFVPEKEKKEFDPYSIDAA